MLRLVFPLAAVVAGYLVLAYAVQRMVLFPARAAPAGEAAVGRAGGEQIWLPLDGGPVEAWFLPALGPASEPAAVLLFAHGNGELIDDWLREFDAPRRWGLSVLLVEYPGYGRSAGRPSERSITAAMVAAYDWAAARLGAGRLVAYGRSVGAGAACALARERQVAALVLESAFTSVRPLARRHGVPGFLIRDPFDNLAVVREYDGPLLLVHGERDDLVSVTHAHRLHRAARAAELHLLPCGHNDCPRPWTLLRRFLEANGLL